MAYCARSYAICSNMMAHGWEMGDPVLFEAVEMLIRPLNRSFFVRYDPRYKYCNLLEWL